MILSHLVDGVRAFPWQTHKRLVPVDLPAVAVPLVESVIPFASHDLLELRCAGRDVGARHRVDKQQHECRTSGLFHRELKPIHYGHAPCRAVAQERYRTVIRFLPDDVEMDIRAPIVPRSDVSHPRWGEAGNAGLGEGVGERERRALYQARHILSDITEGDELAETCVIPASGPPDHRSDRAGIADLPLCPLHVEHHRQLAVPDERWDVVVCRSFRRTDGRGVPPFTVITGGVERERTANAHSIARASLDRK